MTEAKPTKETPSVSTPKLTASGSHKAVQSMRSKAISIADMESEELASAFSTMNKIQEKLSKPDPRREEGEDDEIPVDVVSLPEEQNNE